MRPGLNKKLVMKILHVVPTYFPAVRYGGPIYSVHGLCRALAGQGHDVHVFTTNVDGSRDSDVPLEQPVDLDGVNVWYFPSIFLRRLFYSPAMQRMLHQQIASFDLVHLHSVFLWPTWAAAGMARKKGISYVLSPRGMLVKELILRKSLFLKSCWILFIERKNLERAAAVHLTSKSEVEELDIFSFALKKQVIIANGVAPPADWAEEELSNDVLEVVRKGNYVLFFGRLNWKKGLDRLIRSWKDVPYTLVIAGNDEEGYLAELLSLVKERGVSNRILFLPRSITGSDKEALFASARIFVLPSYSENFGQTVLEAMIRSLPVVVTRRVGAASIVDESGAGIVTDIGSLAQNIKKMFQDEKKMELMGSRGKEWALRRYSWESISLQMADFYKTVALKEH